MRQSALPIEKVGLRGFFRLQIEESQVGKPPKIVGDSGWCKNTVVNEGFDDYLCRLLSAQASSKQISHVALGTGTAPNVTHTTLDGEISGSTKRQTVVVSVSNSKTIRFTATFNSSGSFLAASSNIRNIGLFHNNSTSATLFAGSTYSSSACNTNQNVNITYDIQFS
jgi:hypothetical protein